MSGFRVNEAKNKKKGLAMSLRYFSSIITQNFRTICRAVAEISCDGRTTCLKPIVHDSANRGPKTIILTEKNIYFYEI